MSHGPARGYSWEPFQPGHTLSLRHGADSPRVIGPIAQELAAQVVEVAPWTSRPAMAPTVLAWATAEAVCRRYREWFDERGLFGDDGEPLPGLDRWNRAETRAAKLRAELGLTPQALAKLLGTLASVAVAAGDTDELAALKAEGAAIIELRRAALTDGADGGDDAA